MERFLKREELEMDGFEEEFLEFATKKNFIRIVDEEAEKVKENLSSEAKKALEDEKAKALEAEMLAKAEKDKLAKEVKPAPKKQAGRPKSTKKTVEK